jgi:two-component system sensor histidine kinase ChvG
VIEKIERARQRITSSRAWEVGRRLLAGLWRQLVPIRTRLLVINLVAVLVPVVGIEWARSYEREALRALERDMQHQAQVLRTILEHNLDLEGKPIVSLLASALETVAKRTRMRIRLLDRKGVVLVDSHARGAPEGPEPSVSTWTGADAPPARRHPPGATDPGSIAERVEIKAARKGQLGTATRVHKRIERVYLFVAIPVMVKRRVEAVVYITRSTTPVLLAMHRLRRALVQVLGVALGFTVLMSLFLAATISRPLGRLTRTATRIAGGDRTARVQLKRQDEIGQLARSFDIMVQQLDSRAQYISELAANISHEFKTPLASIRGAAELLADGADDDPAARQRFLENIQKDVERIDRLVSRLLELSRIEATVSQRESSGFDIAESVRQVVDQFASTHPVALEVEPAAEGLALQGNRGHLESAVRALVENAVQHSPADAEVRVRMGVADGQLAIRVADDGEGISEANRDRIFDRFFTTRAGEGGTGLGLAIVSTVVKAHGGTVSVVSEPGKGSTFEVRLPLAAGAGPTGASATSA